MRINGRFLSGRCRLQAQRRICSGSCDSWRVIELGHHSTVERRGNCNYREVQPGDDPEHVIGCDGLLDGFEAKRPFLLVSW